MFTSNPFAELSASVSPTIMQAYVVVMALLVVAGTLFDIIHKRSARYFFDNWRKAKSRGPVITVRSTAIRSVCGAGSRK